MGLGAGGEGLEVSRDCACRELVSVPVVMEELCLGINGALVYARAERIRMAPRLSRAALRYSMEYVVANLDWLETKLQPLQDKWAHAFVEFWRESFGRDVLCLLMAVWCGYCWGLQVRSV